MSMEILRDAYLYITDTDRSAYCEEVRIEYSKEIKVEPRMGDAGQRRVAGLADWKVTATVDLDSTLEAVLWALVGVQTAIRVRKSKTDAISATNPEYQGNGMMGTLPIVSGKVGDVHKVQIVFESSDGVALVRDTTP